jgi:hypothetical protein
MAFSAADLDALDAAILRLAQGERAVEVRFADGRSVKYSPANLAELMQLRAFIGQQVTAGGGDPASQAGGVSYAEWGRD